MGCVSLPWLCPGAWPLSRHATADGNSELPVFKVLFCRMFFLVQKTPESPDIWVSEIVCLQYWTKLEDRADTQVWSCRCSDSVLELTQTPALGGRALQPSFLWRCGLDVCRLASDSAHSHWRISAKFAGNMELTKIIVSLCFQKLSARERSICTATEGTAYWQGKMGLVFFCIRSSYL